MLSNYTQIANLSPADKDYEQSLETLKFGIVIKILTWQQTVDFIFPFSRAGQKY